MSLTGIGLRPRHFADILNTKPKLDCLEILADNYLHDDSPLLSSLASIRASYPMIAHSVGLSIGATDPLNFNYLARIKKLLERFEITDYSDHLCFVSHQQHYVPELLPLPLTQATLQHVIERVHAVQEYLGLPLILENASTYIMPTTSSMSDIEFLNALCEATGAKILLDVNNQWVNAHNHGGTLKHDLKAQHISYLHLGGHEHNAQWPELVIDTHGETVSPDVWNLYAQVIKKIGPTLTIIERDQNIPDLTELLDEAAHAADIQTKYPKPSLMTSSNPKRPSTQAYTQTALYDYQTEFFKNLRHHTLHSPISIYKDSIATTLKATLAKIYEPFIALVGQDYFAHLCHDFVQDHAAIDPVLDHYGQGFAAFLQTHASHTSLPYLADYAAYLFLQHQCFLAMPAPALKTIDLEQPEAISLSLAPNLQFLPSIYPLHHLHLACTQPNDQPLDLTPGVFNFYFIKTEAGLKCHSLNLSQHALMQQISSTPNFMLLCEHYLQQFDSTLLIQDIQFLFEQQLIILTESLSTNRRPDNA